MHLSLRVKARRLKQNYECDFLAIGLKKVRPRETINWSCCQNHHWVQKAILLVRDLIFHADFRINKNESLWGWASAQLQYVTCNKHSLPPFDEASLSKK